MSYLMMLICGILTALPYIFDFLFFLPYFSLAPLFIIAIKKKAAYRHGLVFCIGYFTVVYHWFAYLYPLDFAGFDKIGGLLVIAFAILGMSLMQSIGTALVPFIYRRIVKDRHPLFAPFAAAALWMISEWGQNFFWFGVPWARLAVGQHKILPIIQSASVIGSLGVSFIIVLISGFIALCYLKRGEKTRVRAYALTAAAIFVCNFAFGVISLCIPSRPENTFPVAVIQGNISSSDKWADDSVSNSIAVYTALTRKAVSENGAELVVWPETVIISCLCNDISSLQAISSLASSLETHIAVGAFFTENGKDYNSVYLFMPDGTVNDTVYSKRHLVPFGEYLPAPGLINAVLPFLSEMNLFSDPLTEGDGSKLFDTELGKVGALVCFDSIYEGLALDSVRDGAEIIILSTNDSWYKDSAAVYQHNGHAVLRAVENGRYVIRSANTGISTVINDKGKIISKLPPLTEGYICTNSSAYSHRTPFSLIGNTIVYLSIFYVLYLLVSKFVKKHCVMTDNTV